MLLVGLSLYTANIYSPAIVVLLCKSIKVIEKMDNLMISQILKQAPAGDASTAALMYYYQHMAEKCWGLNSPPGSDASSTTSNPRTSSVDIISGKKKHILNIVFFHFSCEKLMLVLGLLRPLELGL